MLTTEVTQKMTEEWKKLYEENHVFLSPNRKDGIEVDAYFNENYSYDVCDSIEFKEIVMFNIMENKHSRNKLPQGKQPNIKTYCVGDVLIGIDISSGEFCVQCEDINKAIPIYDDLFVYRGLDEDDLKNTFLAAEYVKLKP